MPEFYVSFDVEADGPIPGPHSLLSLGAAAFLPSGPLLSTFSVNFELLEGAQGDPDTMHWWAQQPSEAWEAARSNPQPPAKALGDFVGWVSDLARDVNKKPVGVAYPAGYDFLWLHWMLTKFEFDNPLGFSCIDLASYAMCGLKIPYSEVKKKHFPSSWFEGAPAHTHVAVEDAVEQGRIFLNMVKHFNADS